MAANSTPIITYIDPFGHPIPEALVQILHRQYPMAEIINPEIRFQDDGYNCGPWIVEILRQLVETDGSLPSKNFDINVARARHQSILNAAQTSAVGSYDDSGAVGQFTRESVKIIERRIQRLANTIDEEVAIADTIQNEDLKRLTKEFLADFSNRIEEMVKLAHLSDKVSIGKYKQQLVRYFEDSKKVFEDKKELFRHRSDKDFTIADILRDIEECYAYPFVVTVEELRQEALEDVLLHLLAQIPALPPQLATCFISYAWGHAGHVMWVYNLYKYLSEAGLKVHLDVNDNQHGSIARFTDFINKDEHIVVIGTPELRKKWEDNKGSVVNQEMQMIINRVLSNPKALVKVLLAGSFADVRDDNGNIVALGAFPSGIGGDIVGTDFRNQTKFYENLFIVIKKLYESAPEIVRFIEKIEREFKQKILEIGEANSREMENITARWAQSRASEYLKQGQAALDAKKYEEALTLVNKILTSSNQHKRWLQNSSNHADALYLRVKALFALEKYPEALVDISEILINNPERYEQWLQVSNRRMTTAALRSMILDILAIGAGEAKVPFYTNTLLYTHLMKDGTEVSLQEFLLRYIDEALHSPEISGDPYKRAELYSRQAQILLGLNRIQEASNSYSKILDYPEIYADWLSEGTNTPKLLFERGIVLGALGIHQKALADIDELFLNRDKYREWLTDKLMLTSIVDPVVKPKNC